MRILLLTTASFLTNVLHGHVFNYALSLEVTGLEIDDEDQTDWVGNYTLLPDSKHRGIPTYQNTETSKLLVYDGSEYWQRLTETLHFQKHYRGKKFK